MNARAQFDAAVRAVVQGGDNVAGKAMRDTMGRVRKEISIQRLLEWAFADECAQVDFESEGTLAAGYGYIGNAYRMMQRGELGCSGTVRSSWVAAEPAWSTCCNSGDRARCRLQWPQGEAL